VFGLMLKRLQSSRMFELGDCASITKLRRASKMEFDDHGMLASINMLLIRSLSEFLGRRSLPAAQSMDEFVAPPPFGCKAEMLRTSRDAAE
jgi:hypothetical protein